MCLLSFSKGHISAKMRRVRTAVNPPSPSIIQERTRPRFTSGERGRIVSRSSRRRKLVLDAAKGFLPLVKRQPRRLAAQRGTHVTIPLGQNRLATSRVAGRPIV